MKKYLILTCGALGLYLVACQPKEQPAEEAAKKEMTEPELIARGSYLVNSMGCADCHSPKKFTDKGPVPDMDKFLSGHPAGSKLPDIDWGKINPQNWMLFSPDMTAAVGPWGVSFAANLTPHETGLGNWSLDQFKKAMREGKFKGLENSRPLLPPMPWPNFANLTDEDLASIFAYLKSLTPIDNLVPAPIPPGGKPA